MSYNKIDHKQFIQALNLPEKVKIVEVGPRDGLQNQSKTLSVESKAALIQQLSDCGLATIEIGSLVSPTQVPQMANSDAVYLAINADSATEWRMLVANQKGFDRAVELGIQRIAVFCSATDAFSLNNSHCTVAESLARIRLICKQAGELGISVRAYISCVFGCPYQGNVEFNQVGRIAARLDQFGCDEISLADTIGVGTAGQVNKLLQTVSQFVAVEHLGVHFHNTYGQALVNILTALQSGVRIVDSSVSGLGGCPFAPGATGNVATEDVVYLFNGLGIETGVDLNKLIATSWSISHRLQRLPASACALAYGANSQEPAIPAQSEAIGMKNDRCQSLRSSNHSAE